MPTPLDVGIAVSEVAVRSIVANTKDHGLLVSVLLWRRRSRWQIAEKSWKRSKGKIEKGSRPDPRM
eukprot:1482746-Lingulodinium_polyedra.AAC.1